MFLVSIPQKIKNQGVKFMLRKAKQIISIILSIAIVFSISSAIPFSASVLTYVVEEGSEVLPEDYSNILSSYSPEAFGTPKTSFVNKLSNGNYQVVVYSDLLYIMTYNSKFSLLSTQTIELELPLWGGYYCGENYNYVVCGQSYDTSLDKGGDVYRIIKYDKNFKKIVGLSLNGAETYTKRPFDSGNVSIAENGNSLVVYTSRLRLDGHQSNMTIKVNTDNMTEYSCMSDFWATEYMYPYKHVSHSLRQIVKFDGDYPVYVDLSDGYPERSVYLQSYYGSQPLLKISGDIGDNVTNAEVSGMEISPTNYLVVGSSMNNEMNNIFLSSYNKSLNTSECEWLTASSTFYAEGYGNPKIVKINDDRFAVMWSASKGPSVQYVIVDGKGAVISNLKNLNFAYLSDCEPIYDNNRIILVNIFDGKVNFDLINDLATGGSYYINHDNIKSSENAWNGISDVSWYSDGKKSFDITTSEQLSGLAQLVNEGNTFKNKTVNLKNDIYINKNAFSYVNKWTPIGNTEQKCFDGTFNGNGFSIYNMYVPEENSGGLFGYIGENGIIKALNISQGTFQYGGCVANDNKGIIMFCNSKSLVYGYDLFSTGAICNRNSNLVYGCKNYGTVDGSDTGGIVGNNNTGGTISACNNTGIAMATGSVGGIAGYNYAWIYDCYNTGLVTGGFGLNKASWVAGIVPENHSRSNEEGISNCYNVGSISQADILKSAISRGEFKNCFTNIQPGVNNGNATVLSNAELIDSSFVEKLNSDSNSILPGWIEDSIKINNGMPITIADYNAYVRTYKMIPEMWAIGDISMLNDINSECVYSFWLYFCDVVPEVEVENSDIAEIISDISINGGKIIIKPKSKGTTNIIINFKETENNCSFTYKLPIKINGYISIGDVNTDSQVNAKDRMTLTRYLAKWIGYENIDMTAADVNNDGDVNAKDRMILTRHIAKWQGYENLPYTS